MYESGENYLETILMLQQQEGVVRSVDVGRKLGVSRPSVSRAMGILKQNGYIEIHNDGKILLTDKGIATAEKIYTRHCKLTLFLEHITGVPHVQAEANACRIEHIIDEDIFTGILRYMENRTNSSPPNDVCLIS
jgi:Mn-dependent DtxR family transcriptional regulator